ncbi:MAG: hypothetical protein ACYCXA_15800 [Actinomycetes bacterium]
MLALTDAMSTTVTVDQSVFDAVRAVLDEQGVVELVTVVGAYHLVSGSSSRLR